MFLSILQAWHALYNTVYVAFVGHLASPNFNAGHIPMIAFGIHTTAPSGGSRFSSYNSWTAPRRHLRCRELSYCFRSSAFLDPNSSKAFRSCPLLLTPMVTKLAYMPSWGSCSKRPGLIRGRPRRGAMPTHSQHLAISAQVPGRPTVSVLFPLLSLVARKISPSSHTTRRC